MLDIIKRTLGITHRHKWEYVGRGETHSNPSDRFYKCNKCRQFRTVSGKDSIYSYSRGCQFP